MNCAPILIAKAMAKALAQAESTGSVFSIGFECRASLGDLNETLEDADLQTALVDVIPWFSPKIQLDGRFFYANGVPVTVGLRKKLSSDMRKTRGQFRLDDMAPLLNTFYELMRYFMPSGDNPNGRRLTGDASTAAFSQDPEVVKLWDRELLINEKQYCGVFLTHWRFVEAGQ